MNERGRGKYYDIGYRLRNVCRIIVRSFGWRVRALRRATAQVTDAQRKRAYQDES